VANTSGTSSYVPTKIDKPEAKKQIQAEETAEKNWK